MQLDAFVTALSCLCASINFTEYGQMLPVNTDQLLYGIKPKPIAMNECKMSNQFTTLQAKIDQLSAQLAKQEKELKTLKRKSEVHTLPKPSKPIPDNCELEVRVLDKLKFNTFLCNIKEHGEGWTKVAHRSDRSVLFNKEWDDWKYGFGSLDGEFYLGLEKLHAITSEKRQEFLVVFQYPGNVKLYAHYDDLQIANELQDYTLLFAGKFTGNASESLKAGIGYKFSTPDRNNDKCPRDYECPYVGGLSWYSLGRWFCCFQAGLSFHSLQQEGVPIDIAWYLRPKKD